jgi:hypothetical protein
MAVILALGSPAVCAGWMPTPEARMDCCTTGSTCPMHDSSKKGSGARTLTQDEADRCCASSEHDGSSPSSTTTALTLGPPAIVAAAIALAPPSRSLIQLPRVSPLSEVAHVPKHVLISVFLV